MNRARAATFPSSRVGWFRSVSAGASALSPLASPRARARGRRRSAAPLSYLEAQEIHPALPALGPRTALLPPPLGRATSRSAPLLSSLGVSVNGVSHAGKFREISQTLRFCCVTLRAASSLPNSTGSVLETYFSLGGGRDTPPPAQVPEGRTAITKTRARQRRRKGNKTWTLDTS